MVVGDDDGVDRGYVADLAGHFGVAFRAQPREGTAALCEDGVEQHTQPRGEFHIVTGMAEPGCAQ